MGCFMCGTNKNIIKHHTSYEPEEIVDCCRSCHLKIHHESDELPNKTNRKITLKSSQKRYRETHNMKQISVPDNIHKFIMDNKDSDHKSAGAFLQRLWDENVVLHHNVERLSKVIKSGRVYPDDFTEDEKDLIIQILDGYLQSKDDTVRDVANCIEDKLKK